MSKRVCKQEGCFNFLGNRNKIGLCLDHNIKRWQRYDGKRREYFANHRKQPAAQLAARKAKLKNKYGLTLELYNAMIATQDNKCVICLKHPKSYFEVDHDHVTGKVRGLLCGDCNRALGLFRDNTESLARAVDYLSPSVGCWEDLPWPS
jgi:hypothetical protein